MQKKQFLVNNPEIICEKSFNYIYARSIALQMKDVRKYFVFVLYSKNKTKIFRNMNLWKLLVLMQGLFNVFFS
jgi:hypothetical protein